jgi:hypothetical protein
MIVGKREVCGFVACAAIAAPWPLRLILRNRADAFIPKGAKDTEAKDVLPSFHAEPLFFL